MRGLGRHYKSLNYILICFVLCLFLTNIYSPPNGSPRNIQSMIPNNTVNLNKLPLIHQRPSVPKDIFQSSNSENTGIIVPILVNAIKNTNLPNNLTYQQLICINRTNFPKINNNYSNIFFTSGNGSKIYAWIMNITPTTASIWLRLLFQSTQTIYLNIVPSSSSVSMLNNLTMGEAPQLSPKYGEFDNGRHVFASNDPYYKGPLYWNFKNFNNSYFMPYSNTTVSDGLHFTGNISYGDYGYNVSGIDFNATLHIFVSGTSNIFGMQANGIAGGYYDFNTNKSSLTNVPMFECDANGLHLINNNLYFRTTFNANSSLYYLFFTMSGIESNYSFGSQINTYKLCFQATNLSLGTYWFVDLTNKMGTFTQEIQGPSYNFYLPNGTYSYKIENISLYYPSISRGDLIVRGTPISIFVTFLRFAFLVGYISPWYANVDLNGRLMSMSNYIYNKDGLLAYGKFNVSLENGTFEILAYQHGYMNFSKVITLNNGEIFEMNISLVKVERRGESFKLYEYPLGFSVIILIAIIILKTIKMKRSDKYQR